MADHPESLDHMLAAWNEREPERVRAHLDKALSPEVVFIDLPHHAQIEPHREQEEDDDGSKHEAVRHSDPEQTSLKLADVEHVIHHDGQIVRTIQNSR